jgi:hypothetical protein
MTIVLLDVRRRLVYVNGKNTTPHCLVDPAILIGAAIFITLILWAYDRSF